MVRFKKNPTGPGTVIDRRGSGGSGGGLMKLGAGGGGIALLVVIVLQLLGGGGGLGDLNDILAPVQPVQQESPIDPANDPDEDLVEFLGDVLADSQGMWVDIFGQADRTYRETDLVVFNGFTQSSCGGAQAQSGPHYCPVDERVYMDLDFLQRLQQEFGAAGDTAQAYILAHEVAHHVQNQLGVIEQVTNAGTNEAAIALELQADCFAGVWLSTLRDGTSAAILEDNDLQEALNAAAAVGDDSIQQQTTGRVNPESWTHGSSEQRYNWLKTGFDTGDPNACNTF